MSNTIPAALLAVASYAYGYPYVDPLCAMVAGAIMMVITWLWVSE